MQMPPRRRVPTLIPLWLPLLIAGCASVNTFVSSTGDVVSGRTAQSVEDSRARQAAAYNENASLRSQYSALQAQRNSLNAQLSSARARLNAVNQKLSQDGAATSGQRAEYARLVEKQRDLQQRLSAASAAPPSDPASAARQKDQLDDLTREKDILERQVNALQRAL